MGIKIVIVDDHQIVRDGLRALLEKNDGFEVIGEAGDGRQALELIDRVTPDVCIMDVTMRGLNGVDATYRLLSDHPEIKIIGLSMHSDPQMVSSMLDAGAAGYVPKESAFEEIAAAVQAVMGGECYLSDGLTSGVLKYYKGQRERAAANGHPVLTSREREVLQLIAEGRKTTQIAEDLQVSVKTVESHRKNIMRKLDVHSVAQLTKYALRHGLTSLIE